MQRIKIKQQGGNNIEKTNRQIEKEVQDEIKEALKFLEDIKK